MKTNFLRATFCSALLFILVLGFKNTYAQISIHTLETAERIDPPIAMPGTIDITPNTINNISLPPYSFAGLTGFHTFTTNTSAQFNDFDIVYHLPNGGTAVYFNHLTVFDLDYALIGESWDLYPLFGSTNQYLRIHVTKTSSNSFTFYVYLKLH